MYPLPVVGQNLKESFKLQKTDWCMKTFTVRNLCSCPDPREAVGIYTRAPSSPGHVQETSALAFLFISHVSSQWCKWLLYLSLFFMFTLSGGTV